MAYRKVNPDKSPVDKVIHKTIEELNVWINQGGMIGWIVSDGYIVIDVDNEEESLVVKDMGLGESVEYGFDGVPVEGGVDLDSR